MKQFIYWGVLCGRPHRSTAGAIDSYANLAWLFDNASVWGFLPDGPAMMTDRPATAVYDSGQNGIVVFVGT